MHKSGLFALTIGLLVTAGCSVPTQPSANENADLPNDPVSRCVRFVEHLQNLECADSILTTDSCSALEDLDPELVPDPPPFFFPPPPPPPPPHHELIPRPPPQNIDYLISETFFDGEDLVQPAPDACP